MILVIRNSWRTRVYKRELLAQKAHSTSLIDFRDWSQSGGVARAYRSVSFFIVRVNHLGPGGRGSRSRSKGSEPKIFPNWGKFVHRSAHERLLNRWLMDVTNARALIFHWRFVASFRTQIRARGKIVRPNKRVTNLRRLFFNDRWPVADF